MPYNPGVPSNAVQRVMQGNQQASQNNQAQMKWLMDFLKQQQAAKAQSQLAAGYRSPINDFAGPAGIGAAEGGGDLWGSAGAALAGAGAGTGAAGAAGAGTAAMEGFD